MNRIGQKFIIGDNEKSELKNRYSTKSIVTMALFTAILCVSAYISIALPNGSHITFLNFIVTLIALVFPTGQSFLIVLVWTLLGAIGVPVFIGGNAGIGYLFSALGGYSIAFLFVSVLLPPFFKKNYHRIRAVVLAVLSVIFVDFMGMLQLMYVQELSFMKAMVAGFLPFIVLDIVKAVAAAWVAPAFRNVLQELS